MSEQKEPIPAEMQDRINMEKERLRPSGLDIRVYELGLKDMWRWLQEDKPKGTWVKASDRLPLHKAHWVTGKMGINDNDFPVRTNGRYYMANIYDQRSIYETSTKYMLQFDRKEHYENEFTEIEWLDESVSDDLSALRSENERLKGEAVDYRNLLEQINEGQSDHFTNDFYDKFLTVLEKYPNPTT